MTVPRQRWHIQTPTFIPEWKYARLVIDRLTGHNMARGRHRFCHMWQKLWVLNWTAFLEGAVGSLAILQPIQKSAIMEGFPIMMKRQRAFSVIDGETLLFAWGQVSHDRAAFACRCLIIRFYAFGGEPALECTHNVSFQIVLTT